MGAMGHGAATEFRATNACTAGTQWVDRQAHAHGAAALATPVSALPIRHGEGASGHTGKAWRKEPCQGQEGSEARSREFPAEGVGG